MIATQGRPSGAPEGHKSDECGCQTACSNIVYVQHSILTWYGV